MSDSLRLFFALPLPDAALELLAAAQARAKPVAERLDPRWTTREQMHVTLKFLGHLPADALPRLTEIAEARARGAAPFEASLTRVVTFPNDRRARILAVDLETPSPVLAELAQGLEDDAAGLGIEREKRAYRAHATLARFKQPGNARFVIETARIDPVGVECRELRLYRSTLSPKGSRYEVLVTRALGG